jgi:hypothetical protein
MAVKSYVKGYARRKLTTRLIRAVPWVGAVVALATLGQAIRQKGLFKGSLHSALDAIPFVGGAKNLAEAVRGRDLLPDKAPSALGPKAEQRPVGTARH